MIDISTVPGEDDEEYFDHFQKYIETRFRSITVASRVREQVQWSMAVKMHRIYIQTFTHRKTKVAHRDRKDKKEKERTKTKALDLEILKMQMAMKFPFRILRGSSKTGDERHQKAGYY
jgi:hypothetical protein